MYCRCDRNAAQLEGAAANADAAARQGALPLLLMHADATRLPLHDGSVDAVLSDLPFGRKHGRREGLYATAAGVLLLQVLDRRALVELDELP